MVSYHLLLMRWVNRGQNSDLSILEELLIGVNDFEDGLNVIFESM